MKVATWPTASEQSPPPAPGWSAPGASLELRLPPLPFEDVYLYRKKVHNGELAPPVPRGSWRFYGRAFINALLVLVIILFIGLPRYLERDAAHRLLVEEQRSRALEALRLELEAREAAALSPARLDEWARSLELVDPAPGQLVALAPGPDRTLAARFPVRVRREPRSGGVTAH